MTLSKVWRGLAAVSVMALVSGCGWFGGGATPTGKARPGADRAIAPSSALPPAPGGAGIDSGATAVEESTPAIGSIVPGKGGQKAQKEALEKEAAERDAIARKEREERDAAEKAARAAEKAAGGKGKTGATPAAATEPPAGATPAAMPPAAAPPAAEPPPASEPVLPPIPPAAEPR